MYKKITLARWHVPKLKHTSASEQKCHRPVLQEQGRKTSSSSRLGTSQPIYEVQLLFWQVKNYDYFIAKHTFQTYHLRLWAKRTVKKNLQESAPSWRQIYMEQNDDICTENIYFSYKLSSDNTWINTHIEF